MTDRSEEATLLELIARERSPAMRKVLERYRAAQIELLAASDQLEKLGRYKWALGVAQRAHEVGWHCQVNLREDRNRVLKIHDFRDDLPTNPRGYPAFTGLQEQLEPEYTINHRSEVISNDDAVFDTDRAPPPSSQRRRELLVHWALNIAIAIGIGVMLYLVAKSRG